MQQRDVERKLQEICQDTKADIRPETPILFSDLVYLMRNLDTTTMRNIYRQINDGALCRGNKDRVQKIFLDTIPMISTSSSVEMMKELLMNSEITGLTAEMWMTTLAFIQTPTKDMLSHAKSILEIRKIQEKAMLPISSLVNNFCSQTADCASISEVSDIINVLENILGSGCYVRDANLEKALLTLRAIGNAGNSNTVGSSVLNNCFTRKSNPMEVRVAALEAYRRLPCTADRSEPMTIFRDRSEDSELRISAYLAVVSCPSEENLSIVKATLEMEDNNQVGSFVWSHLTNLMETSSPHKQAIRLILDDSRLKSEFNMEKLKYSRNYEGSFMLERINTGALVESNVIWSSKSFIPRSAMLNLTVDLFGNSINLMELGGRIEGLEYLLETYLGPMGYFGDSNTKSFAKSKAKLDQIRASMYMRMFGNEMAFTHFKGIDSLPKLGKFSLNDLLNKASKNHDISFTQSIMFLDSSIIIPTSVGMPLNLTVNGVATVDMKASGKMNLKEITQSPMKVLVEGEVQPSGAVAITGSMAIDASVTQSGMKMVSTLHSSTSAKGRVLLHGTKIASVEFDMPQDKMEILDVKTAFFIVHGEIEQEQKMITENRQSAALCSGSKLAKITGLELCGEVSFPNASMKNDAPYFPLTGPVGLSLILHKRDSHLGYRLLAKRSESRSTSVVQLALDTPGSRVDRSLSFDFVLNRPAKELEIKMVSPWKKASTKGTIVNRSERKSFNGHITVDDKPVVMVDAATNIMRDGDKVTYQPKIVFSRPLQGKISIDGKVITVSGRSASFDIEISPSKVTPYHVKGAIMNIDNEMSLSGSYSQGLGEYSGMVKLGHDLGSKSFKLTPYLELKTPKSTLATFKGLCAYKKARSLDLSGSMSMSSWKRPVSVNCKLDRYERKRNQVKYTADVVVNSKLITVKLDGSLDNKKSGISSRVTVDYNMPKYKRNKLTFSSKLGDKSTKNLKMISWKSNFDVKRNPEYSFSKNLDMIHNAKQTKGTLDIRVGTNPDHRLYLDSKVNHKGSMKAANVKVEGTALFKPLGIDIKVKGDHKHSDGSLGTNMNIDYAKGKSISSSLQLKDDSRKKTKMGGEFTLSYPGNSIVLTSGLTRSSKKDLQHTINLNIGNDFKSSIITDYNKPRRESHEFSTNIIIPSFKPIKMSGNVNLNPQNFKMGGHVDYEGQTFKTDSSYKYTPKESKGKIHEFSTDIILPTFKPIRVSAESSTNPTKYRAGGQIRYEGKIYKTESVYSKDARTGNHEVSTEINLPDYRPIKISGDTNMNTNNFKAGGQVEYDGKLYKTKSVYKAPRDDTHEFSTDIILPSFRPIKISGETNLNRNNFKAGGQVDYEGKEYKAEGVYKYSPKEPRGKMTLDLIHPDRHIALVVDGKKNGNKYTAGINTMWDAASDRSKKVSVDGMLNLKSMNNLDSSIELATPWRNIILNMNHNAEGKIQSHADLTWSPTDKIVLDSALEHSLLRNGERNIDASLSLITPFETLPKLSTGMKFNENNKKISTDGHFSWANNKQLTSIFSLRKPFSLNRMDMSLKLNTPFKGFKKIVADIDHDASSKLRTELRGSLEKTNGKLTLSGSNSDNSMDASGAITSNIPGFESVSLTGNLMNRNNQYQANFAFDNNGIRYLTDLDMSLFTSGYQVQTTGTLLIALPNWRLTNSWNHRNTYDNVKSSLTSEWGRNKLFLDFSGLHQLDTSRRINGDLIIQTPWTPLRDIEFTLNHQCSSGFASLNSVLKKDRNQLASIDVNYKLDQLQGDMDFTIINPFTEDLVGKVNFRAERFPVSGQFELQWSPVAKMTADGSLTWTAPYGIDGTLRLTTPFEPIRSIVFKGSNKYISGRMITTAANLEYGIRQAIDVESRIRYDGNNELSLKVKTPFNSVRDVNLLGSFIIANSEMDVTAGVEVQPIWGKLSTSANAKWASDLFAKLRIDTPYNRYPYLQIEATSSEDNGGRHNRIEAEYSPRKIISLQSTHSFSGPIAVEVNFNSPYQYMENLGLVVKHAFGGKAMQSHAEVRYAPSKIIEGDWLLKWRRNIEGSLVIKTPITQFEMSKLAFRQNGDLSDFSAYAEVEALNQKIDSEVSFSSGRKTQGEIVFHSPFTGFEELRAKAEFGGSLQRMKMVTTFNYGQSKEIQAILRNSFSKRRLDTSFILRTPFFDTFKFTIDHDGILSKFTNKISSNLGRRYSIDTDVSFDMSLPNVDFTSSVNYRMPGDNKRTSFNIHKDGTWNNMNGHVIGQCNGREMSIKGNFKAISGVEGMVTISSPYYDDAVVSISHNGDWTHFNTKASASLGSSIILTTDNVVHLALPSVDISNTLTYRMYDVANELRLSTHSEGDLSDWNGKITATVDGTDYSTSGYLRTMGPLEASVTVSTPIQNFRDLSAYFKHSGSWDRFTTTTNVKYMDGKKLEAIVNFMNSGLSRMDTSVLLTTPYQGYERTEWKYNHNVNSENIDAHTELAYSYNTQIIADIKAAIQPRLSGSIIITTPFEHFLNNRLIWSGEGSWMNFKSSGELEFDGEKMNVESEFNHGSDTNGRFSFLATSPNVKDVVVVFARNGPLNDFTSTWKLTIAKESMLEGQVTGRFVPDNSLLSITLRNPYTEDIGMTFKHDGEMMNCRTTLDASLGESTNIHGETTIQSSKDSFEIDMSGNYMLAGEGDGASTYFRCNGPMLRKEISAGGKYADQAIDAVVSYNIRERRPSIVSATLNTPFEGFRNLAYNLKHERTSEKINTFWSLRYMDNQEISADFDFSNFMWSTIKTGLTLRTPFSGYRQTKIFYEHTGNEAGITCNCNIQYGRRQTISYDMKLSSSPKYSVEMILATPFRGFETMSYTGSAEIRNNNYNTDASFKWADYPTYTVNAELNMDNTPMTGSIKLYTPISHIKNVDASFTHNGDWRNFRSSGSLETPVSGRINGEITMDFTSVYSMDGVAIVRSELPGMEELKLAVRNTDGAEQRSHIEAGWQPTSVIVVDGGYRKQNGWYNEQYQGDFALTTPFDCVRDLSVKSSSSKQGQKYVSKIETDFNGETILDMDTEWNTAEKCEGMITMHQPRATEFSWVASHGAELIHYNLFVNWDKNEPNSNLRMIAESKVGDMKNINIKLINPRRTVVVRGNFMNSAYNMKSQGEFAWDEQLGRKIFYELDVADNSRRYTNMYDASMKIGVPSRTLQWRGTTSVSSNARSVDTAFLWDADRDSSKIIGFKTNFIPSAKTNRADITITLPENRQPIRIGTEMTLDNGRTLFDGKTEFSYSPDSRKTLILTSNIQDVSNERGYKNYSLSLGIRHLYTETDVQINSHIGSSSEKLASGMQMEYLTASRRRVNMALLGDIDRLRRQINVQVISPMKSIEVSGEIKNMKPYEVVVNSRIDGTPVALAAVSLDTDAKSMQFEANYDPEDFSNMFHIDARYVNSSAIETEAYLESGSRHNTQSLMTMTLQNPKLLQARLYWRPSMMNELQHYAGGQWRRFVSKFGSGFDEASVSVGQELSQKYKVIAEAISEEVAPYIDIAVTELRDLERQMKRFTRELRKLHYRNDWYIRSMGDSVEHYFLSALESYRTAVMSFNTFYTENTDKLASLLENMKSYPIGQHYKEWVDMSTEAFQGWLGSILESSEAALELVDEKLRILLETYDEQQENVRQHVRESLNTIINHPRFESLRSKWAAIRDVDYLGHLRRRMDSLNLSDKYNSVIYSARDLINRQLEDVMQRNEVKYMQARANEVYQQGKWAYQYWNVEENIESALREMFVLLKEILEDELAQAKVRPLLSKPEIRYEDNGEIVADIHLPISINNLEGMPEIKDTVIQAYNNYVPSWKENNTTPTSAVIETPKVRQVRRRYRQ